MVRLADSVIRHFELLYGITVMYEPFLPTIATLLSTSRATALLTMTQHKENKSVQN